MCEIPALNNDRCEFISENQTTISSSSPSMCIEKLLVSHYGNIYSWVRMLSNDCSSISAFSSIVLRLILFYCLSTVLCFTFCLYYSTFIFHLDATYCSRKHSFLTLSSIKVRLCLQFYCLSFRSFHLAFIQEICAEETEEFNPTPKSMFTFLTSSSSPAIFFSSSKSYNSNGQLKPIGKNGV